MKKYALGVWCLSSENLGVFPVVEPGRGSHDVITVASQAPGYAAC
jgi:hypothetical protein